MKNWFLPIYIVFIAVVLVFKGTISFGREVPLFKNEAPLDLTLEADVLTLIEDKSEDPEYIPATLIHHLADFKINVFEIKVKPRGKTRRVSGLCEFPPLKFNFKKNHLKNTVFDGQDKLKFVSQCRLDEEFQHYVLEEYLLYKIYTLLTEQSYRVRLVNITVKDINKKVPDVAMVGFLIEDDKSLADRIGAKRYDNALYNQDSCTASSVDRLSMFQYMIGNTDWYINTKHNIDIFQKKEGGGLIPVPYDFDFAGVINAPYASPSKQIPITEVKQRYFKGSCREVDAYDKTISMFNSKQLEIYDLYSSFEFLPKYKIKKSLKYYNKFYKIINDSNLIDASFLSVCDTKYLFKIN